MSHHLHTNATKTLTIYRSNVTASHHNPPRLRVSQTAQTLHTIGTIPQRKQNTDTAYSTHQLWRGSCSPCASDMSHKPHRNYTAVSQHHRNDLSEKPPILHNTCVTIHAHFLHTDDTLQTHVCFNISPVITNFCCKKSTPLCVTGTSHYLHTIVTRI